MEEQDYELITTRIKRAPQPTGEIANGVDDALRIAQSIWAGLDQDVEHAGFLALDAGNRVIGYKILSSGDATRVSADPRAIFRHALMMGAAAIVVVHNHPSGGPQPSEDDRDLTFRLGEIGRLLGVIMQDHLILGSGMAYHSMRRAGMAAIDALPPDRLRQAEALIGALGHVLSGRGEAIVNVHHAAKDPDPEDN